MTDPDSPLQRPISLSNLVRGLIAVVAMLAIADAFYEGRTGLAIAGLAFVLIATALGVWAWRARQRS